MLAPGAPMSTEVAPQFEKLASVSVRVSAATDTTLVAGIAAG